QRGLPIQYLMKYFKQQGERWQIDPAIRSRVRFRVFNLLEEPTSLGGFDVIFCRNVLIYFDQPTKTTVLARLSRILASDGYLFLGGAETVLGISDKFQASTENRGVYSPVTAPQPQQRVAVG
ncbi:MAG TPA: CheR family methyltransferase, partial [Stellaceae bacterium]|nr:CheR family methyltransferase [Stellaceae bacterium]